MTSSCFACLIFLIISIPFSCRDTAVRVDKAMIGTKVITLCLAMFALFLKFRARTRPHGQDVTAFSHFGNQAEISHMSPRQIGPGNQAHVN